MKLGKNYEEFRKNFSKICENTSYKLKKKTFLWKLCEIFKAIFGRTYEKLQRNIEKILEIFGAF